MSTAVSASVDIEMVPTGYRYSMLIIAYIKRALLICEMEAGERLYLLEGLNKMTDSSLTPKMLAMIEPMSDTEMEIVREAKSLDQKGDRLARASFDILTSREVFGHFLALNPSLLDAIKSGGHISCGRR